MHMRQKELAGKLGILQPSLCEIEYGKNLPSADTITNFIRFTNFPVLDELVRCSK